MVQEAYKLDMGDIHSIAICLYPNGRTVSVYHIKGSLDRCYFLGFVSKETMLAMVFHTYCSPVPA